MSMRSRSRAQEPDGSPCLGIGAKIGKAIRFSTVKASRSRSPLVTEGPSLATTWRLLIGSSGRLTKAANSKTSGYDYGLNSGDFCLIAIRLLVIKHNYINIDCISKQNIILCSY